MAEDHSRTSRHPSPIAEDHSRTSRRPSPMAEDHDVADPPHLLSRLTVRSTATSSATLLPLGELPQPSPVIPSPSKGADLASQMTDAIGLVPLGDDRKTATPFIKSVGFYASLPVLQFYGRHYKCCYNSFDLSSIYAVKYHLTTRIRLYQLSFLISTIPGPRYHFPAFSDLPVI